MENEITINREILSQTIKLLNILIEVDSIKYEKSEAEKLKSFYEKTLINFDFKYPPITCQKPEDKETDIKKYLPKIF